LAYFIAFGRLCFEKVQQRFTVEVKDGLQKNRVKKFVEWSVKQRTMFGSVLTLILTIVVLADEGLALDFVRCSVTEQILAIFLTALIFLWLLSLHQGKESNTG
jgi:hypothetical protein